MQLLSYFWCISSTKQHRANYFTQCPPLLSPLPVTLDLCPHLGNDLLPQPPPPLPSFCSLLPCLSFIFFCSSHPPSLPGIIPPQKRPAYNPLSKPSYLTAKPSAQCLSSSSCPSSSSLPFKLSGRHLPPLLPSSVIYKHTLACPSTPPPQRHVHPGARLPSFSKPSPTGFCWVRRLGALLCLLLADDSLHPRRELLI